MFLVYLASTDESATILDRPLLRLEVRPTEVTDELIRDVVRECITMNDDELPEGFETMAGEDALEYMRELHYYSENIIAIVEEDKEKMLAAVGDALGRTMHGDSSCYAAAEAWGAIVMEHALEKFEI